MEFFQFCLEIVNREVKKFNVPFDTAGLKKLTSESVNDCNYELIKKRCHFLYRFGTINLYFAENCFRTFLLDNKIAKDLLSKWKDCSDLTFCSISTGPALDYVAFLHSFQKSGMIPPFFKNIKIISKHGAWRNTANIMHEIISEGYIKSLPSAAIGNVKVLQGDPFKDFSQKIKSSVSTSDVIMMMNRLNLKVGYNQTEISNSIQVFLDALKPGAVLFCIDSKQCIKEIFQLLNLLPGTFLLKPTSMETTVNFDFPNVIKKHVGCLPILTSQGRFLVWQKSSISTQRLTSRVSDIAEPSRCQLNLEFDNNTLSVESKCNKELSTSKKISGQNATTSSTSSTGDYQLKSAVKTQYSDLHLPSTSSQNASIQTEPDDILHETEEIKIIELVHRVENLTLELTKVLNDSELRCTSDCYCFKEYTCTNSDSNDNTHGQCASAIAGSKLTSNVQNCKACYDHNDTFSKCCLSDDHAKINVASCNLHDSTFKNLSINHSSLISAQSNSSSPQLVIPLANLSPSVVSQIVSLISQSEKQQTEVLNQIE